MTKSMSFRDLEIFQLAKKLAVETHQMTLKLPKFELYEEGSQIRRSSKSVVMHIVEGYGRRTYKNEFLKYIIGAISECDETQIHLEMLFETKSLTDDKLYTQLHTEYNILARKLNSFYKSVSEQHMSKK